MEEVWHYPVELKSLLTFEIPIGAKPLGLTTVDGKVRIYMLVNPKHEKKTRRFEIYATGESMPRGMFTRTYIGTFTYNKSIVNTEVYHVFLIE